MATHKKTKKQHSHMETLGKNFLPRNGFAMISGNGKINCFHSGNIRQLMLQSVKIYKIFFFFKLKQYFRKLDSPSSLNVIAFFNINGNFFTILLFLTAWKVNSLTISLYSVLVTMYYLFCCCCR